MPKLTVLQGLPGCGKSRIAEEMVLNNRNAVRVSKDSLRHMLYFVTRPKESSENPTTPEKERFIAHLEFIFVHLLLSQGRDVVVDDTNLNPERVVLLRSIALMGEYGFELHTLKLNVAECVANDAKRSPPAGEAVIRSYAEKWKPYHDWIE